MSQFSQQQKPKTVPMLDFNYQLLNPPPTTMRLNPGGKVSRDMKVVRMCWLEGDGGCGDNDKNVDPERVRMIRQL